MPNSKNIAREVEAQQGDFSLERACQSTRLLNNLREIILSHPNEMAREFGMSIIYLLENSQDKMIECLEYVADRNPHISLIQRKLAEVYINQEKYNQAITYLKRVLTLDKEDLTAQVWLCLIYYKLEETKNADLILKDLQTSVFRIQVNSSNWS